MAKDTKGKNFNDFTLKELTEIQDVMSKKRSVTPSEAAILLEVPTESVYRLIKAKKISAFRPFGSPKRWMVDVQKTLKMIERH